MGRLTGTVISIYPSADKYGGSFGEIQADDGYGKCYVFSGSHVFRNRSHAALGIRVTFEDLMSYATNIDQVDKPE